MELSRLSGGQDDRNMYEEGPRASELMPDEAALNRKTVWKLDLILLPFLALLFLFNSLDRSNIGNAETANFTADIGLAPSDLNTAIALFFAFFVALQPVGAALGRRYGMAVWVPACMTAWGVCTALHVWVRHRWQLFALRVIIGALEAGFYPTTVSYLSLFYTRYEFARRLALFYGQSAVAGAFGGILSYAIFSHFPSRGADPSSPPSSLTTLADEPAAGDGEWRSWQILFLLEGGSTIILALAGFAWLPRGAGTAWFLNREERAWAEERVRRDREHADDATSEPAAPTTSSATTSGGKDHDEGFSDDDDDDEENASLATSSHALLRAASSSTPPPHTRRRTRTSDTPSTVSPTSASGLTPHDILSALLHPYIYPVLALNILSALPATAFSVFLPLVLQPLSATPALANLLAAPPYLSGALALLLVSRASDRRRERVRYILGGLVVLVTGLVGAALLAPSTNSPPTSTTLHFLPRYLLLTLLLTATFLPPALTVAWLADNTPRPGKRALLLGLNGWGNLAGVLAALLFAPRYRDSGYALPMWVTAACAACAAGGWVGLRAWVRAENARRGRVLGDAGGGEEGEVGAAGRRGRADARRQRVLRGVEVVLGTVGMRRWAGVVARVRVEPPEGDERVEFLYRL